MTDYSIYKYHELLEFLDYRYKCSSDRKNYADYMLSMNKADSLKKLFIIYENVYVKILEYLGTNKITGHSGYDEDLNVCLNENILRLFLADDNLTLESSIKYLVNIRNCGDISFYHEIITDKAGGEFRNAFLDITSKVIRAKKDYFEAYNELLYTCYEPYTNGYKEIFSKVKSNYKTIVQFGYIRLIGDYLSARKYIFNKLLYAIIAIAIILFLGFILKL